MTGPPDGLIVGPHRYRVIVDDRLAEDGWGITDHKRLTVAIGTGQAASQERDTVLHEALHTILFTSGVGGAEGDLADDAAEERVCRAVAPLLLDVLRRNPAFVGYLLDDTEPASARKDRG